MRDRALTPFSLKISQKRSRGTHIPGEDGAILIPETLRVMGFRSRCALGAPDIIPRELGIRLVQCGPVRPGRPGELGRRGGVHCNGMGVASSFPQQSPGRECRRALVVMRDGQSEEVHEPLRPARRMALQDEKEVRQRQSVRDLKLVLAREEQGPREPLPARPLAFVHHVQVDTVLEAERELQDGRSLERLVHEADFLIRVGVRVRVRNVPSRWADVQHVLKDRAIAISSGPSG